MRSERAFGTHQGAFAAGITDMDAANAYVRDVYLPAFNAEFAHPSREDGSAFVPCPSSVVLDDLLCEQVQRTVGEDNCVRLDGLVLQIPADRHRYHYITTVTRHNKVIRVSHAVNLTLGANTFANGFFKLIQCQVRQTR